MNNKHSSNNIFTNSGIRAIANTGILQPHNIALLGQAISQLLHEEFEDPCAILIATDTRTSSPWIKEALLKGLNVYEHDLYDAGICPTPFVAKALTEYEQDDEQEYQEDEDNGFFQLGIMVTASHNPAEYNGIKILTEFGYLTQEIEEEISSIYYDLLRKNPKTTNYPMPECIDIDLIEFYQNAISQQLHNLPLRNLSITLDCANGATAQIAPQIFQSLGIKTVAINNDLDGSQINKDSGCSNPNILLEAMKKHNSNWGCAFDGDGDRVIIVHESGKVFDGDDILYVLSRNRNYQNMPVLVGSAMTNQGLVDFLKLQNKSLIRAAVGERNIISMLMEKQALLGAETCGHISIMDHAFCSDGIFAALLFFDTLQLQPTLIEPAYTKYPQVQINIPLKGHTIDKKQISLIVSKYQNNTTRIIVRTSNTEPVLRIMVEHHDKNTATKIAGELQQSFLELIK